MREQMPVMAPPYKPLRELLVVSQGAHEAVLVVRIYLDESGHAQDPHSPVVSMAGCLAPLEAWERFEADWRQILNTFHVSSLHMKDLAHFRGEFSDWTEERRRSILGDLISIIEQRIDGWVGALLPVAQFHELSPEQRQRLGDPYFICLQDCIHAAIISVEPSTSLEVVIAKTQEHTHTAKIVAICCANQLPDGDRLDTITVASARKVLPLQAADLLAYELTKMGKLMLQPERQPLRYPMERLKNKCFHVEFYERPLSQRI